MKTNTIKATAESAEGTLFLGDDWVDPLEAGVRTRIRGFIEELLETELDAALGRDRYERPRLAETGVGGRPPVGGGHPPGPRQRPLLGTFGPATDSAAVCSPTVAPTSKIKAQSVGLNRQFVTSSNEQNRL